MFKNYRGYISNLFFQFGKSWNEWKGNRLYNISSLQNNSRTCNNNNNLKKMMSDLLL